MRLATAITATITLLLTASSVVVASEISQKSREEWRENSFLLRAGRIITGNPLPGLRDIEDGFLLVICGEVADVGPWDALQKDLKDPTSSEYWEFLAILPVLEFPESTIMAGMVAAASDLGGRHRGDESVAAGYRAVDSFDRYGDYTKLLAAGVTTVHIAPGSHRLLTGQGAVVKLGGPPAERVLREASDLAINVGDAVFHPPQDVTYPFPASADIEIVPGKRQRPDSRMGLWLGLEESIRDAMAEKQDGPYSVHPPALARAWKDELPLRIHADRAADILAAIEFLKKHKRKGYIVGGAEAEQVTEQLVEAKVPLIYQPRNRFRTLGRDIGRAPDALDDATFDFKQLAKVPMALVLVQPAGESIADLRLAAIRAVGAGLDRHAAIMAITRGPAAILGVHASLGHIDRGADADFVVLSGDPLDVSTHVQRVYIGGRCVFQPPTNGPLVVKAGTIWAGPGKEIRGGEVLIEEGKIVDVGRSVPHPPFARVIDAGEDAFVTPGLIDAHSHLGLDGDRSTIANDVRLSKLIGVADVTDLRVCRAGITTVMMSPYMGSSSSSGATSYRIIRGRLVRVSGAPSSSGGSSKMGSPAIAVKTAGRRRTERVIDDPAAVLFDVSRVDPMAVQETLKSPLEAGKKYLDSWTKYEKDLKEFLEKKEKGETTDTDEKPKEEETKEPAKPDPLSGTWKATVTGAPLPKPVTLTIVTQLTGSTVEGRITQSSMGFTGRLSGTFDGKHLSAQIEVNVPGVDVSPTLEADLVEEDRMKGTIKVMEVSLPVEGNRVDKKQVELTVKRTRRTRGKDGRPLPPKVDESLEPLKKLLEKKIPALVKVSTPAGIREVLALLVDKHELPVVLLGAEGAAVHAEKLADKNVTVVMPPTPLTTRRYREYNQSDVLARAGVPIAFQSNAEDAARDLPSVVMFAVERGLDAEDALTALTAGAAKAMKIDDRVGTLEPGKDGDLVIFSGHPFRGPSRVLRVVVDGKEVRP